MPEAAAILHFERRLVELGCPAAILRRRVQELADHHEDLAEAAREEGLSEAEAATRAAELLGEPAALAAQVVAVLRQSSWWGRHPVVAFCLLPPLVIPLVAFPAIFLWFQLLEVYFTEGPWAISAGGGPGFPVLVDAARVASGISVALVTLMFCWLARRSASGLKCVLSSCVVCALHGYFAQIRVMPHTFSYGCNFPPFWTPTDWVLSAVPMVIGVAALLRHRLALSRLPAARPFGKSAGSNRNQIAWPGLQRRRLVTPTSLATIIVLITLAALVVEARTVLSRRQARAADLKSRVWPTERAAVIKKLLAGQKACTALPAVTISLNGRLNCALVEPVQGPPEAADNNLAGVPRGIHVFAGVPFDVQGRLQLAGRSLLETRTQFSGKVKGIAVGRQVQRLHLLHAASSVDAQLLGQRIAGLVLHYADGSQQQIPIVAGDHILDWWGPIYQTDAGAQAKPTSPASELAWVGVNPWIARERPELSLRLYRTTFENPMPDREVATVDYVSALTDAAPFMVGLTVE